MSFLGRAAALQCRASRLFVQRYSMIRIATSSSMLSSTTRLFSNAAASSSSPQDDKKKDEAKKEDAKSQGKDESTPPPSKPGLTWTHKIFYGVIGTAVFGALLSWALPPFENAMGLAVSVNYLVSEIRRKRHIEQLLDESVNTVGTERTMIWRDVPLWRLWKRYRVYMEARMSDPFFAAKTGIERFAEFLEDCLWGIAQPTYNILHDQIQNISDEAFLLPKQSVRGRLTVLIDYRCLFQFYYDEQVGVIVRKRPGLELFLERVSKDVDLVLVCDRPRNEVEQFLWKMDPYSRFTVRLYRQALIQSNNKLYKPMHKLGRNASRILVLDQSLAVSAEYTDNVLVMKPWGGFGIENTCDLLALMPFIQLLAKNNVDVRDHLHQARLDHVYLPELYNKVRVASQMAETKQANVNANTLVTMHPQHEFWDTGTMPELDPWDNEPEPMIRESPGGMFYPKRDTSLRIMKDVVAGTYEPDADTRGLSAEVLRETMKIIEEDKKSK